MCSNRYNWSHPYNAPIANLTMNDTIEFFKNSPHPLDKTLSYCMVFGNVVNCSSVFTVVPTDRGESTNFIYKA